MKLTDSLILAAQGNWSTQGVKFGFVWIAVTFVVSGLTVDTREIKNSPRKIN
jgi:hypothetical protein